jgi:hypothetical protein
MSAPQPAGLLSPFLAPSHHFAARKNQVAFGAKQTSEWQAGPAGLVANDPKETLTFELQDHDRRRHLLSEISRSNASFVSSVATTETLEE